MLIVCEGGDGMTRSEHRPDENERRIGREKVAEIKKKLTLAKPKRRPK